MAVQTAPAVAGTDNGPATSTVVLPRAYPGKIVIFEHVGHGPPIPGIIRSVSCDGKSEITVFTQNSGQPLGKRCVFHRDDPGYTPSYSRNYGCWYETPEDVARARREQEEREVLAEAFASMKEEIRHLRSRIEKPEAAGPGKPAGKRTTQAPEVTDSAA